MGKGKAAAVRVKRVYEQAEAADGARILVDRLWPRGIAKEKAAIDAWLRDLAPGDGLRKRFHGHPEDWEAFRAAYAEELRMPQAQAAVAALRAHIAAGPVTLIYAAKDEARNNAVALRLWLLGEGGAGG